ncbi:MAG: MMPL family transporter [Planctomycetes bacterium]|nr:MMPL family transporter [Planctomycetota bacterium]
MARLLLALHRFAWRRPRAVLAIVLVFCLASGAAAMRLRFSSDIVNILPQSSPAVDAVSEVMSHFSFTGQLFIYFEKIRPDATDDAAMGLAAGIAKRMRGAPEVTTVDERITPESEAFLGRMVTERGPLMISDDRMAEFLKRLEPDEIRKVVRKNRRRLASPGVGMAEALAGRDPLDLARDFYLPVLSAGRPSGKFDFSTGYYFDEGRKNLIMTVEGARPPHDIEFGKKFVALTNRSIAEARAEVKGSDGWQITLLGGYPIALASEKAIKSDMGVTIFSSIPPVLVMLLISLRRWRSLAIGFVALHLGIIWTFGLAGLAYGHLTGVTVGFSGLLAGMGIDFTIHFFSRYRHEREAGLLPEAASEAVYTGAGPGVFIAMITSVASLLCLWVSEFKGLREFATLVGFGLLFVFTGTLLMFPLFIRRLEKRPELEKDVPTWVVGVSWVGFLLYNAIAIKMFPALGIATAAACLLLMTGAGQKAVSYALVTRPAISGTLALILTVIATGAILRAPIGLPERETDVKNLRTEGDNVLEVQERMKNAYGTGIDPLLIIVRGASEEEALEKADAVAKSVAGAPDVSVQAITQFVPPLSRQRRHAEALAKVDAERVIRDLDAALDAEGFDTTAFEGARESLRRVLVHPEPIIPSKLDDPFFNSIRGRFLSDDKIDSPARYRSLVWVTPKDPLHLKSVREHFINGISASAKQGDAGATLCGFNVVVKEIDDRIGGDIGKATLAAGVLTFVLAWILFGSLPWALLALLPGVIGTLWLIGALRLMEVKMNYLNLIVFPLMMGMGTDNGLHLVARFRELGCRDAARTMSSLWRGLTMTSLTTVVGFGSLAFAANRAMKSLGIAISVGMLAYLFASLLVVPPILKWLEGWKQRTHK